MASFSVVAMSLLTNLSNCSTVSSCSSTPSFANFSQTAGNLERLFDLVMQFVAAYIPTTPKEPCIGSCGLRRDLDRVRQALFVPPFNRSSRKHSRRCNYFTLFVHSYAFMLPNAFRIRDCKRLRGSLACQIEPCSDRVCTCRFAWQCGCAVCSTAALFTSGQSATLSGRAGLPRCP